MAEYIDFENINLSEVSPDPEPLPEGVYTLQVLKAEQVSGVGKQSGKPYVRLSFTLMVTDDEKYTGRRLFESLFPGEYAVKGLRRLMDATGVPQEPGQPIADWLKELSEVRPTFKAYVRLEAERDRFTGEEKVGPDGKPLLQNSVNWYRVMAA